MACDACVVLWIGNLGRDVGQLQAANLRLLFSSTPLPLSPTHVATHGDLTLVAQGGRVAVLDRAKLSHYIGEQYVQTGLALFFYS
jgi:hypothetical protein